MFSLSKYDVYVYLLNYKGAPKFVTEKSSKSTEVEDFDTVPEKTLAKVEKLLTDKYGEDYFDLLYSDEESEETEIGIGNGGYFTADELLGSNQLEYRDLKYSKGVFTNSGSFFSQIVLSDTEATTVTFKFSNTGPTDMVVTAEGSGDDIVSVPAKSSKTITFESDPEKSHLFIIRFDKDYDSGTKSSTLAFKLSDLKAYAE